MQKIGVFEKCDYLWISNVTNKKSFIKEFSLLDYLIIKRLGLKWKIGETAIKPLLRYKKAAVPKNRRFIFKFYSKTTALSDHSAENV